MYYLKYKCRQCGEVFRKTSYTESCDAINVVNEYLNPCHPKNVFLHHCKKDVVGIADLIGMDTE